MEETTIVPAEENVTVIQVGEDSFTRLHKDKREIIERFIETGYLYKSFRAVGYAPRTHYNWLASDPDYREQFTIAEQIVAMKVDDVITERAIEGREESIFYKGEKVGVKREPSDLLLIFKAKGLMPEKYRERQTIDIVTHLRQVAEQEGLDANELMSEVQRLSKGTL